MSDPSKPTKHVRTRPLARRLIDGYGLVFLGIIATLLLFATLGDRKYGEILGVLLLGCIFMLALVTSAAKAAALRLSAIVVIPLVLVAIIAGSVGSTEIARDVTLIISALLVIGPMVVIGRHIASQRQISMSTVMGALCIYLFAGLLFAMVYLGIATVSGADFFAQNADPESIDYIYFSFTTLTTLGYGDLTPALGIGQMAAIIEAVMGQLYLVTIVAVAVGRLGSQKTSRR